MNINKQIIKVGIVALVFATGCSSRGSLSGNSDSISNSFMDSCNPNNDTSMNSVCSCAESSFREANEGSLVIRGVSESEMNVAVSECRR